MGIKNGTLTFIRFQVEGVPALDELERSMAPRAFLPISGGGVRESFGWAPPGNPHTDSTADMMLVEEHGADLLLVVRKDEIKIPRAALKKEARVRLEKMAAEEGKSADDYPRAIKKACEQSVLSDLIQRIPPTTKLAEMVWNPAAKELLVFAGGKLAENAVALFERTTGLTVRQADYAVQSLLAPGATLRQHAAFAKLEPGMFFASAPSVPEDASPPQAIGYLIDKQFIGREFLTFLLFDLLNNQCALSSTALGVDVLGAEGSDVNFAIGSKIQVVGDSAASGPFRCALNGSSVEDRAAAKGSVLEGALVTHLALEVGLGSRAYKLLLGADGTVRGLKLPDLYTEPTEGAEGGKKPRETLPEDAVTDLRLTALAEIKDVVDHLYGRFLKIRLCGDWRSWANDLRDDLREAAEDRANAA